MMTHRRSSGLALLTLLSCGPALLKAQAAPQSTPTVGSTYKNIQVFTDLKDAPTARLINTMQFMSGSLGVSCNFCHVSQQGPFDSDANEKKQKAREMIKMVRALNAASFDGHQAVTCYTCHRGRSRPIGTPAPWDKTPEQIAAYKASVGAKAAPAPPAAEAPALPSVAEVFQRYRNAIGAVTLTSLRLTGINTVAMNASAVPFEADAVFPDKFLVAAKSPGGEVDNIVSGSLGWRRTAQSSSPLPPPVIATLRTTANILLNPVKFETSPVSRTVIGTEQVGDKQCYVVEARLPDGPERLYFDVLTGLLYKAHTELGSALGNKVEERTFEDYRTVGGLTLPFVIRNHYMEDQSEFRISTAEINVAFDLHRFDRGGER